MGTVHRKLSGIVRYGVYLVILSDVCRICVTQDPYVVAPIDVVAERGSTVVLHCALRRDMGAIVLWSHFNPKTRLRFMVDAQLNADGLRNRVTVIGRQHAGEFNLRIADVRESDAGRYECRALIGLSQFVRRSAMLTVVAPAERVYPKCRMQPQSGLVPGQMVILTCETTTPSRINWYRGPHVVGVEAAVTSVHRHTLTLSDYGVLFECRESGPAVTGEKSCALVPLPATLTVDIRPKDPMVHVGDTETFGCYARGAMSVRYSWYLNGIPLVMSPLLERFVVGGEDQLLTAYAVTAAAHGTVVTCAATANTGQVVNASSTLHVVPRQEAATQWPEYGVTESPSVTHLPDMSVKPGNPGRPNNPQDRPGRDDEDGESDDRERPDRDRPGRRRPGHRDVDSGEDTSDELSKQSDLNDDGNKARDSLKGGVSRTTLTVIGAAMAGIAISVVIVVAVKIMTCVRPGIKDSLINDAVDATDSDPVELNSGGHNTFNSVRSAHSYSNDSKRITFSDLNRTYDIPPLEPDDGLSYLGLRPESMVSGRFNTYEGLSISLDQGQHSTGYYEVSSGEYDQCGMEYEDVISEQASMNDSRLRPISVLSDDGIYLPPVSGYNSRISMDRRGRPT